jgi:hypothetical protein
MFLLEAQSTRNDLRVIRCRFVSLLVAVAAFAACNDSETDSPTDCSEVDLAWSHETTARDNALICAGRWEFTQHATTARQDPRCGDSNVCREFGPTSVWKSAPGLIAVQADLFAYNEDLCVEAWNAYATQLASQADIRNVRFPSGKTPAVIPLTPVLEAYGPEVPPIVLQVSQDHEALVYAGGTVEQRPLTERSSVFFEQAACLLEMEYEEVIPEGLCATWESAICDVADEDAAPIRAVSPPGLSRAGLAHWWITGSRAPGQKHSHQVVAEARCTSAQEPELTPQQRFDVLYRSMIDPNITTPAEPSYLDYARRLRAVYELYGEELTLAPVARDFVLSLSDSDPEDGIAPPCGESKPSL